MTIDATLEDTMGCGDVAAALDAARPNVTDLLGGTNVDGLGAIARRDDVTTEIVDLEQYLKAPRRQQGTVKALTGEGFITAFRQRVAGDDSTPAAVYADIDSCTLTAVLNDDEGQDAGWRDFRITYAPQATPEWTHWIGEQGLVEQDKFAATLEGGETEIRNPTATVMLELAETFHASSSAKFKQAGRRRDGRIQLAYEEEIEAQAGEGMVDIPEVFTIEVRPFYGADPVTVECKLRFRLDRGDLKIGYTIHRPDEIRRQSFIDDVVAQVTEALAGFPVLDAVPAAPR